jgi:hypothetical protein
VVSLVELAVSNLAVENILVVELLVSLKVAVGCEEEVEERLKILG